MWPNIKNSLGLIVSFVAGVVTGGASVWWYKSRECEDIDTDESS